MGALWTDAARLEYWRRVEVAAANKKFTPAAAAITRKLPRYGTSQKPAARDPTMEPTVFAAQARPTIAELVSLELAVPAKSAMTIGKAKPKIVATGNTVSPLMTNCATSNPPNVRLVARSRKGTTGNNQWNAIKDESAAIPIHVWLPEKVTSEIFPDRATKYRKDALPRTIPVRNIASIVVNAYVELLTVTDKSRVQAIS